ncbi:MAG: PilZ domain-containing protein [Candidatus Omnitrophota bacterium]|nr:PilZ domain-containing protein [Candidatus Omnitrophota bacterium]
MPEKRKFTRFKTTLYVKYSHLNNFQDFSAIAQDISMSGIKITLDKSIKICADDFITLYLLIPQITIKVIGKIIWVNDSDNKKEAGIIFINIPDTHKEDIYNYIFRYYREEITNRWWKNM